MILARRDNGVFQLGQTVIHRGTCQAFTVLDIGKDGDLVLNDGRTDSPDNYCTIYQATYMLQAILDNVKLTSQNDMALVLRYHKERADRLEQELKK